MTGMLPLSLVQLQQKYKPEEAVLDNLQDMLQGLSGPVINYHVHHSFVLGILNTSSEAQQ